MNRAKKSYRSMPLSFPTIFLTIFLLFCLLLFANLAIAQSAELSKKYPELQKLQDAGGSVIGELDYNLDPGWWQWSLSCDRAKWVSYGQKYESCEQQKHDFESVVKPTLSKTTEVVVPANGKIVLFTELRVSEGSHPKEPAVSFTLQKKDGSSGTIGSPTLSRVSHATGNKIGSAPPKPLNRNAVEKGDKIIIKIEASWYVVSYRRAIPAQGARVQVFFIPDVPEVTDSDKDGVPDDKDKCHDTPAGTEVDEKGCPKGGEFTWSTTRPDSSFTLEPDNPFTQPDADKPLPVGVIGDPEATVPNKDKYAEMIEAGSDEWLVHRLWQEDEIRRLTIENEYFVLTDNILWVCVKGLEGAAWAGRRVNFILGCGTGTTGTFSSVLDVFYAYADRRIQAVDEGKSLDEAHELGISAAGRKGIENIGGVGFSKYKHFGKGNQWLFNIAKQISDWNLFDPINVGQMKVNIPSSDIQKRGVPEFVPGTSPETYSQLLHYGYQKYKK